MLLDLRCEFAKSLVDEVHFSAGSATGFFSNGFLALVTTNAVGWGERAKVPINVRAMWP